MTTLTSSLRRIAIVTTIVSFSVAAFLGILAILTVAPYGDAYFKVMGTTFVVGVLGLAMLCYAAVAGRPTQLLGAAGALFAVYPFVVSLIMIWEISDWWDAEAIWRSYFTTLTIAATLAQVCLLLSLLDRRTGAIRPVAFTTIGIASVVGLLIIYPIIVDTDLDFGYFQLLGVLAILDALGTVSVIALRVFDGPAPADDRGPGTQPHPRADGAQPIALESTLDAALTRFAADHGTTRDAVVHQALQEYLDRRPPSPPT